MNWLKNKKFQYGSAAVALTALVIVLVILFNVILTTLSDHFGWYADTSQSGYSTLSDTSRGLLDSVDGRYHRVTICFLSDENLLGSTVYGSYILSIAKQMEQFYDFISLEFIASLNKDILKIRNFFGNENAALFRRWNEEKRFTVGTVLLRDEAVSLGPNGTPLTDAAGQEIRTVRIDLLTVNDLYSSVNNAFLGNFVLTGRVVGLTKDSPVAAFITGHGEMTVDEDGDYGKGDYLNDLLIDAGFQVKKTLMRDLSSSGAALAILFAPKTDFTDREIEQLSVFVDGGGHLLYFADDVAPKQPLNQLNGFLADCGIETVNAKYHDGGSAALSVDGYLFAASYNTDASAVGAIAAPEQRVAVSDCRVLRYTGALGAEPLLLPSASASLQGAENVADGREAVAILSTGKNGQVFATGASSLASSLLFVPSYSNRDLLLSVLSHMGFEHMPLNIEISTLATDGLDITKTESTVLSVLLSAIPALLVLGVGIFIYVRRKNA